MRFAERIRDLGTEASFEVLARAQALEKRGRKILHFEMGEPKWATDAKIVRAGIAALERGKTRYTNAAGEFELRRAIAKQVSKSGRISVSPEEVVVVNGAKPILFFAALALINPGDEVILSDPGFPIFESAARFVGARIKYLKLRIENHFQPDPSEIKKAFSAKTRMVIVNSPHNPTGMIWEPRVLKQIAEEVLNRKNCWLLSDEIYSQMIFDGHEHFSPISIRGMKARTILVDGFSKTYSMTGWRLGYGIMPAELAEVMTRLVINSFSCVPQFIQAAGVAALESSQAGVKERARELARRRDLLVTGLNSLPGFHCLKPPATPYAFPRVKENENSLQKKLLEKAGIACVPGTAFGRYGARHLRFSFTNPPGQIHQALDRLNRFI